MDIMKRSWAIAVALAILVVAAQGAWAQAMLLGTIGTGPDGEYQGYESLLVEIDPDTGALVRTIGPVGHIVNGLAWDRTTGTLYGSAAVHGTYNGLLEISLDTGAGTPIGVHGWGLGDTWGPDDDAAAVTNIAVNSSGQMYGWWDPNQDDLVAIDKSTGVATWVGESGVGTFANGLAFDSSDTLYMVNGDGDYYTVDPTTGTASEAGDLEEFAHHGVFDLSTDLYYGIGGDYPWEASRLLVVADLAKKKTKARHGEDAPDYLHTLAFVDAIPEPGSLCLLAMGGSGLVALWRRRRGK